MGLSQDKIHSTVLNFLGITESEGLRIIGDWFFKFLISNEQKMSLIIPIYKTDLTKNAYLYVRAYYHIYKLSNLEPKTDLKGYCLFDIFSNSSSVRIKDYILENEQCYNGMASWEGQTITRLNEFLPVFDKLELIDMASVYEVKNSFELFKAIRLSKTLNHPIKIDVTDRILVFNNLKENFDELVSEKEIVIDKRLSPKEAKLLMKEADIKSIELAFQIKYPHSRNPIRPLTKLGEKKFNLVFRNRFSQTEIAKDELVLLNINDELKTIDGSRFEIVGTDHNHSLFSKFKELRYKWNKLEVNKFINPFPKYWFLFINKSIAAQDWINQFKLDYPKIAEKPIIKLIEEVIEEIVALNWVETVANNYDVVYFPELRGNRGKRLEFVYRNFTQYVSTLNDSIEFKSTLKDIEGSKDIMILNGFDILELINNEDLFKSQDSRIVFPDFLYFGKNPWLRYIAFNLQADALLSGMRESLDENYLSNKNQVQEKKVQLIKEIKESIKQYRIKYESEEEELEEEKEVINDLSEEDIELTNDEESDRYDHEVSEESWMINEGLKNEFKATTLEDIYVVRNSLVKVNVGQLKLQDCILKPEDLSEIFKSPSFLNLLTNRPKSMESYQSRLKSRVNPFQTLKNRGLHIGEHWFNKMYVVDSDMSEYIVPKRKSDWRLICDLLEISASDRDIAFLEYYGRSRKDELKRMYRLIIDLLIENDWVGSSENPIVIEEVSKIISFYKEFFNEVEDFSLHNEAENIIKLIVNHIQPNFIEIQSIKKIDHE